MINWDTCKIIGKTTECLFVIERSDYDGRYYTNIKKWNDKKGYENIAIITSENSEEAMKACEKFLKEITSDV